MAQWTSQFDKPPTKSHYMGNEQKHLLYELSHTYQVIVSDEYEPKMASYYEDKETQGWFSINDYDNVNPLKVVAWWSKPAHKNY